MTLSPAERDALKLIYDRPSFQHQLPHATRNAVPAPASGQAVNRAVARTSRSSYADLRIRRRRLQAYGLTHAHPVCSSFRMRYAMKALIIALVALATVAAVAAPASASPWSAWGVVSCAESK